MAGASDEQDSVTLTRPVSARSRRVLEVAAWFLFAVLLAALGVSSLLLTELPEQWFLFGTGVAALALVSWVRPEAGLLLVLLLLPLDRAKTLGAAGRLTVNVSDIVLALCCAAGFIRHRRLLGDLIRRDYVVALLALAAWIAVALAWTHDIEAGLTEVLNWTAYVGVFLLAALCVKNGVNLRSALGALLVTGCAILVLGLIEALTGMNILEKYATSPIPLAGSLGGLGRIAGPWMHPNRMASYSLIVWSVALALLLTRRSKLGWAAWPIAVIVPGVMFPTQSLSGLAGMVGVVAGVCILYRKLRKKVAGLLVVLVMAGLALSAVVAVRGLSFQETVEAKIESVETTFGAGRFLLWPATLQLIYENPLAGSGTGSFSTAIEHSGRMPLSWIPTHAHNTYLHIAAENGLVGLGLFVLFVVLYVRHFFKERIKFSGDTPEAVFNASGLALAALLCVGLGETFVVWHGISILLFALLGAATGLTQSRSR